MSQYYYELNDPVDVDSIERLLKLNVRKTYWKPGDPTAPENNGELYAQVFYGPFTTAGFFRGQLRDWPLVPSCYRGVDDPSGQKSETQKSMLTRGQLHQFREFCERAERQNPDFPRDELDRMSIAQHFGIRTALLDWSRSILPALYFTVGKFFTPEVTNDDVNDDFRAFIYHIRDERLIPPSTPTGSDLYKHSESALVKPYVSDRRIERQLGMFIFHPHPIHQPKKIPVDVYTLGPNVVMDFIELLEGFGMTTDHFFPDYAGIAEAVKTEGSI